MSGFKELADSPGRVLEIGVGGAYSPPNPTMLYPLDGQPGVRRFLGNSSYLGVDQPKDPTRYFFDCLHGVPDLAPTEQERLDMYQGLAVGQRLLQELRPKENISFTVADAHNLPFAEDTFDEVFIGDVIGSDLHIESKLIMFCQAARVLKPMGRLVIRESITPNQSDPQLLPEHLALAGLHAKFKAEAGEVDYESMRRVYGAAIGDMVLESERSYGTPFYLLAEKR